jgi:hypothetical protein
MPNYKNKSKFYKQITVNGKRINVPPGQVFYSERDLGTVYDFFEPVNDNPTFQPKKEEPKKVEIAEKNDFRKLEKAILILNDKIQRLPETIESKVIEILESTPAVEQEELERVAKKITEIENLLGDNPVANLAKEITELKEYVKSTVERRQGILKDAIEEINQAVSGLEKHVYEGGWDNLPIVVEEDKKDDTGPSIEDILKENK